VISYCEWSVNRKSGRYASVYGIQVNGLLNLVTIRHSSYFGRNPRIMVSKSITSYHFDNIYLSISGKYVLHNTLNRFVITVLLTNNIFMKLGLILWRWHYNVSWSSQATFSTEAYTVPIMSIFKKHRDCSQYTLPCHHWNYILSYNLHLDMCIMQIFQIIILNKEHILET
jgi:hypothetical protein